MPTTIRLPEALKTRIAAVAERAGQSAHAYMLDAIASKTEQDERRADFESIAGDRYEDITSTGKTIGWNEMRQYMLKRAQGVSEPPPKARKVVR